MKVLVSIMIGVFAVAALLSGVLLYQNWTEKQDEAILIISPTPQPSAIPINEQNQETEINDTTQYELILAKEVECGDMYPQVGYCDCLVVKLMPDDEPIQADSIITDEVLLTLSDKLNAYSVLLHISLQNMDNSLIDAIPGLMGTEEAILTTRIKNDILIAMRNLELKAAKKEFETDIIKYKYGEIDGNTIDASAQKYLAAIDIAIQSLETLQGMD